nr:MAG TPA_asm: hypothetical protein [Caudoviricetes sp.]
MFFAYQFAKKKVEPIFHSTHSTLSTKLIINKISILHSVKTILQNSTNVEKFGIVLQNGLFFYIF